MTTWTIDPMHSEVHFKVKHLVISTITGSFKSFSGTVNSDSDDFKGATVTFEADVNSINTGVEQRDQHLQGDDFFAAEKFPKISFEGKIEGNQLTGNLTIRDVTKPVTLDVDYGGTTADHFGNVKAGFEINGKISRKEFGVAWHGVTEAGGVIIGEEVKLIANVELLKAQA